ncbi:MAG: hypothetical protein ACTHMD_15915 [Flavisolibacter sp.]
MAKASKKKSAKEASNIFHNIMQASVKGNPKPKTINMNKGTIDKLRKDLDDKFAKYINSVETNNTGGISTSKNLYLAALTEWENAWRIYLAEQSKK